MKLEVMKELDIPDDLVDKIVIEALKKDFETICTIIKGNQKVNYLSNEDDENFEACAHMLEYYMGADEYDAFVKKYLPIYASGRPSVGDIGYGVGKNSDGNFNTFLLTEALKENVLTVTFYKKDGSVRTMDCTLMEDYIGDLEYSDTNKRTDPDLIRVYDVDLEDWRSFRVSKVISVEPVGDELTFY